ncbi:glutathione S-transferase family protein [Mesorhizobium sp. BAC0120]|uniref:glutathione S-transferase family protein n=1 Tax=Mesorhizobium sp. BAC0120 TaxID=3090670 RepID=UPI00298C2EBE|nr:glutathione S-transferase family protein [Mesorhizobium sp. BAC0120]MDW6020381.1 glutathione S-transferase family protein [Mesorhizobium sp. BAC0120]
MQPILLAGFPLGSSLGLVMALEWLGQPYRLSRVEMPNDMLTNAYGRLNGRRETPVLVTADGALTETMAIALWLETRDRERRISFEPGSRRADRLHQYMGFLNSSFTSAFSPLWTALEIEDVSDEVRETLRTYGRAAVAKRHQQLEAMIDDNRYLLGDRPTLADAMFVGVARWADFHQAIDPADFPRLRALKERLEGDPAFGFAKSIEDGRPASGSGAMAGLVTLDEAIGEALALAA